MKKVSKAIKAFIAILNKPYLLNAVLNSEELFETEFQGLFPSANEKKQISFSTLFLLTKFSLFILTLILHDCFNCDKVE